MQQQDVQLELSFEVKPKFPGVAGKLLGGSLKLSGAFGLAADLHPGDQLTVQIANADGEVIASALTQVASVGFAPIKVKGEVIGLERAHKARLT